VSAGLLMLLGMLVYGAYAWVSFSPSVRASGLVVPVGLSFAFVGNLLWLSIVVRTDDTATLTYYGLVWDSIVTASFVLVPVLLFGVRFTAVSAVGCLMVLVGLTIMKIGTA